MSAEPRAVPAAGDEPWWWAACMQAIAQLGGKPCPPQTCLDVSHFAEYVCNCMPPYLNGCWHGGQRPECCAYSATSPFFVAGEQPCYCCCGGIGVATLVGVSADEARPLRDLGVGDTVHVAADASLATWHDRPLAFSSGAGQAPFVALRFGTPERQGWITVGRDQPVLTAGGRLVRAARLVPGAHELVRPDGRPEPLLEMLANDAGAVVHQIATSSEPATDAADHLYALGGVVVGDYALQLADLDGELRTLAVEGHAELPEVGSEEYTRVHGELPVPALAPPPPP